MRACIVPAAKKKKKKSSRELEIAPVLGFPAYLKVCQGKTGLSIHKTQLRVKRNGIVNYEPPGPYALQGSRKLRK